VARKVSYPACVRETTEERIVESDSTSARAKPLRFAGGYAFVGSGCLLVLELVAGRILAPEIGVSLYTWTSVIGVVLAGVSLGNYLGGRIADRRPTRAVLSAIYVLGGIASALVILISRDPSRLAAPHSVPAVMQVLWLTALMFFVPSTLLAMPTPLLVKLSLSSLGATGRVVGRVQASAALGSIVGTFSTGFFLISWFGTRAIVTGVAGTLIVLGGLANPAWTKRRIVDTAAVVVLVAATAAASGHHCLEESNYYCIRVVSGPDVGVRTLLLDHLVHGYVDLRDPSRLLYQYELLYQELLDARPRGSVRSAFAIGGGTYTFPRYANARLGADVMVAEIDPAVTAVARSHLGLVDNPRLWIVHDDARRVLLRMSSPRRFDVIVGDAFNDAAVPYHLTTIEFDRLVAGHLHDDGVYVVNVVDAVDHDFLRSFIATLRRTFPFVNVLTSSPWPPPGGRDTFVVAASRSALPMTPSTISATGLDAFERMGRSVVLTDDRVPVDQLLAPVFRQRLEE
jgi:spermidine synthase